MVLELIRGKENEAELRAVETPTVLAPANEWNELREALAAFDPRYDGKRLDARRIGYELRAIKGRVIGRQRLIEAGNYHRAIQWKVQSV